MGLTLAAPPAAAAGAVEPTRQTTLAAGVAARVAATANRSVAIAPTLQLGGAAAGESKPFFKTGRGIAALVLMVGASAWLVQSRTSDNVVHSPGRK
jgi:hypothetical protein